MRCPYCKFDDDKVLDSRAVDSGNSVRRRRECTKCKRRYTTYERVEERPTLVIKKGGEREPYDRMKVLVGIGKACEKRSVSAETQEKIVQDLDKLINEKYEREVPSEIIGEFIMKRLSEIDEVAYVRFASVYRQFKDINHFLKELKTLLSK
ncbi:MAG: transcriptional repressor NrdR [Candidatus Omnitrophica bacterium]|nr:transcriptional repressor NrdR [Candidatus Omnitrophota bacterium]